MPKDIRPAIHAPAPPETPASVAGALDNPATLLFARVCLTSPFWFAGLFKLLNWPGGLGEMAHFGLEPTWAFNLAALVTELAGSALVIANRKVWLGAGALGVFTVLTTLIAHRPWDMPGQTNAFLEHAAIASAFILVAVVALRPGRAP